MKEFIVKNINPFHNRILFYLFLSHVYQAVRAPYSKRAKMKSKPELKDAAELDSVPNSGFPPLNKAGRFYIKCSTIFHTFLILQTLVVMAMEANKFCLREWMNCYVIGRITGLPRQANRFLSFVVVLHITWRTFIYCYEKRFRLDVFPFLLRNLARLQEQLAEEMENSGQEIQCKLLMSPGKSSKCDYMRDILYMKFIGRFGNGFETTGRYLLRPNRTLEARQQLEDFIDFFGTLLSSIFVLSGTIFFLIIILGGLSDYMYLESYPSCWPELEDLAAKGEAGYLTTHFNYHRAICAPVDIFFTLIVITEISSAMCFPAMINIILVKDLLIYWKALMCELNRLRLSEQPISSPASGREGFMLFASNFRRSKYTLFNEHLFNTNLWPDTWNEDLYPQIGVQIVQQQIIDFFAQLKHYDRYVSHWLTTGCFIWLAVFVTTCYLAYFSNNLLSKQMLYGFQLISAIVLASPMYFLMQVSQITKKAYPIMNTLMARERDASSKAMWARILDYYDDKINSYGFTVFFSYQANWMMIIQMFGYAGSFIVLLETFKGV